MSNSNLSFLLSRYTLLHVDPCHGSLKNFGFCARRAQKTHVAVVTDMVQVTRDMLPRETSRDVTATSIQLQKGKMFEKNQPLTVTQSNSNSNDNVMCSK